MIGCNTVEIEYFQTMLPIWLLKRTAQNLVKLKMQWRKDFAGEQRSLQYIHQKEKTLTNNWKKRQLSYRRRIARLGIKRIF